MFGIFLYLDSLLFQEKECLQGKKRLWNMFIFRVLSPEDLLVKVTDLATIVHHQDINTVKANSFSLDLHSLLSALD